MTDVDQGEWNINQEFQCRLCGDPAFISKINKYLWGCKTCGYTTQAVFIYFKERKDEVSVQGGDSTS